MKNFTIQSSHGPRTIGVGHPCFIVAEVSCNHLQKIDKAKAIISAAAEAGADAVKMQTFTADTITIDSDKEYFLVGGEDNPDSWKKDNLYQLYKKAYAPWDWFPELKKYAEKLGLVFFSSPFDETAVDFLEGLGVDLYKVASYEMTHIPMLKKIGATGKPVIMSVGFNTADEAEESVAALRSAGSKDIALLHCLNTYADEGNPENTNLNTIRDLAERFDVVAGFSDNNGGIDLPILAAAVGASIIEKHLVVSHDDETFDKRFSLDPKEMTQMIAAIRSNEKALGTPHYGPVNEGEKYNLRFRRSIFVIRDMKKGDTFTTDNIRVIRPSNGLEPKYYEEVLNLTARKNIERGMPLSWHMVNKK